jgi:anti-anti-sigma regulatory factor
MALLLLSGVVSEETMLGVHIDKIGDLAIVECEGRLVRSEAAFQLRQAITSQRDARIIVLDLSQVSAIEGGGLGMLVFLRRWAYDHDIRFKLFNPTKSARDRLERANSMPDFEIASRSEVEALLAWAALVDLSEISAGGRRGYYASFESGEADHQGHRILRST